MTAVLELPLAPVLAALVTSPAGTTVLVLPRDGEHPDTTEGPRS